MDSPWLRTVFKLLGLSLMVLNVVMHGSVALFIGGPFGLVLYLVGFIGLWATGWYTLRRWHEARDKTEGPSVG